MLGAWHLAWLTKGLGLGREGSEELGHPTLNSQNLKLHDHDPQAENPKQALDHREDGP